VVVVPQRGLQFYPDTMRVAAAQPPTLQVTTDAPTPAPTLAPSGPPTVAPTPADGSTAVDLGCTFLLSTTHLVEGDADMALTEMALASGIDSAQAARRACAANILCRYVIKQTRQGSSTYLLHAISGKHPGAYVLHAGCTSEALPPAREYSQEGLDFEVWYKQDCCL